MPDDNKTHPIPDLTGYTTEARSSDAEKGMWLADSDLRPQFAAQLARKARVLKKRRSITAK